MNLYDILEIKSNANESEIKKAYHRLALLYHPDKNKDIDASDKFKDISYAYQILINQTTRQDYCKLSNIEQNKFVILLKKIFGNNLVLEELKTFGINFEKNDWEYLENNFYDIFEALNLQEILNFFKSGTFPKKKIDLTSSFSDTDNNIITNFESYFDLPIYYQKNLVNNIKINLDISLNDIIENNKRKIKIKRNINNKIITNTFIFNIEKPYIIYSLYGDSFDNNTGHLIIKLNLSNNFLWTENLIIYNYYMTLYEMLYGITVKLNMDQTNIINISDWLPYRDGFFIEINKLKQKDYIFAVKLELDYEHSIEKEKIIKQL